jgi:hypothetical protein
MSAVGAPLRPEESHVSMKPAGNQAVVIALRDAAAFEAWLDDAHVDLRAGVAAARREGIGRPVADRRRGGRPVLRLDLRPAQGLRRSVAISSEPDAAQA